MKRLIGVMAIALTALPGSAQGATPATASNAATREVLRQIVDPSTGNRWLLERQAPGAPGRLVLAEGGRTTSAPGSGAGETAARPVIRAGEPVAVTAHTAVMDAELEGIALNPARAGVEVRVRLKIGGRIVSAIAVGPGRAEWKPQSSANEARP